MANVSVTGSGQETLIEVAPEMSKQGRRARKSADTDKQSKDSGNGVSGLVKELWQAAVTLRGAIEPADYKRYVLPIIFLRFLSLRYERRRAESRIGATGTSTSTPTRRRSATRARPKRPGTSSPATTAGSARCAWPKSSWQRCARWGWNTRSRTARTHGS